ALPKVAHAGYCLNDPQTNRTFTHWPNHTLTFKINSASLANAGGAAARQAIADAFTAWASTTCGNLQIVDGGDTTATTWMLLGVNPNPTNTASVMYMTIPYGETSRRTLTQDDQDAIAYLYPQASPTGACTSVPPPLGASMCPDNTGGSTGGSGGGGSGGNPG